MASFTDSLGDIYTPNLLRDTFGGMTPGAPNTSFTGMSPEQQSAMTGLSAIANGTAVTPAQLQMKQGLEASQAAAMSQAAAQRGVSPGLSAHLAMQAQAENQQKTAQQTAMLRAQEQQAALGGVLHYGQGQQQLGQEAAQMKQNQANFNAKQIPGMLGGLGQAMNFVSSLGGGAGAAAGGDAAAGGGGLEMAGGAADAGDLALMAAYKGGSVPSHMHPVAQIYHPGFNEKKAMKMKGGGRVPGKPKMMGDHRSNDTVKAVLSPGEVVIPNHVMQSDDPVKGAADFVANELAKRGGGKESKGTKEEFKAAILASAKARKGK